MSVLFKKITNQIIKNCKDHVMSKGKLWNQDSAELISVLQVQWFQ